MMKSWESVFFALISAALLLSNSQAFAQPAVNPEVRDSFGNLITGTVRTGQQIEISTYLTNHKDGNQTFAYLVQIQDANGVTISLSWITGILAPYQSFNPAQSWIPKASGTYVAQIFFWESLTNPNSIQQPVSAAIEVCNTGLVAVMKNPTNSLVCVRPDTAQKLVERRWGQLY